MVANSVFFFFNKFHKSLLNDVLLYTHTHGSFVRALDREDGRTRLHELKRIKTKKIVFVNRVPCALILCVCSY